MLRSILLGPQLANPKMSYTDNHSPDQHQDWPLTQGERQDKRTNYSREKFVEKVWEWKEESGGQITRQLRRLGCSMDWSREQFTMDEHFTKAVLKVFVDLYNDGLIYRDKRLVNWDPELLTAISDLEVEQTETKGHLWHLRYPIEGKPFDPDEVVDLARELLRVVD